MEIREALLIKSLILKDLNGNISEEEKQILDRWTNAASENFELQEHIRTNSFMQQIVTDESGLEWEQWEKLRRRTIGQPRRVGMRVMKYAAAILIPFIIATGIWLFKPVETQVCPVMPVSVSGIKIELADGSVIPLQQDSIINYQSSGIAFNNYRDTMQIISSDEITQSVGWNKVIIPKGMDYIVRLEDGSSIHLSAESMLEVPGKFDSRERRIRLTGEAYLNVRHEDGRPFIVETIHSSVKVLGTQFNLRAYPEDPGMTTTLIHGSVEVASAFQKVVLEPGKQAIVMADGEISLKTVNTLRFTAWRDRRLVFENEYMADILTELRHWYDYDFIITDPAVRDIRLSMNVERFDDFNDLKKALEKIEKIRFQISGRIVKITT